jgi:hypothetical protein
MHSGDIDQDILFQFGAEETRLQIQFFNTRFDKTETWHAQSNFHTQGHS